MADVSIRTMVELELVTCCNCGVQFGLPSDFDKNRQADKDTWYCPNGHAQSYIGRPIRERLTEAEHKNLLLRQQLDQAEADAARKGKQLASLKKRVKNGVCPSCRRHFMNVQRHISRKHPDLTASQSGEKAT